MYKKVKNVIKCVDIFGVPIQLNFDGNDTYTSCFGGGCTFTILMLTMIFIYGSVVAFIKQEQVQVQTTNQFSSSPLPIYLTPSNFVFAVKIDQPSDYTQSPFFIVNVTQYNSTGVNGTKVKTSSQIKLEPCKLEYFQAINSPNLEKAFNENQFSKYLCPTMDTVMLLQGAFLNDDQFSYVRFTVDPCIGYTNQSTWNVTCASQEEISTYYKSTGAFRIAIYTSNFVTNPQQASNNYSQAYLSEDLSFTFQPEWLTQNVNVYFKEEIINTDTSQVLDTNIVSQHFINRQDVYQYQTDHYTNYSKSQSAIIIYFRRDYFTLLTLRRFMKIDQLMASFGGIFNIFFISIGLIVKLYNTNLYKLKIAKNLYELVDHTKPPKQHKKILKRLGATIYDNDTALSDQEQINNRNQIQYLTTSFVKLFTNGKIRPKFSYWIYQITCRKLFRTIENRLLNRAINQVTANMNLRSLIQKQQQLDKLKSLLLNNNQLRLFEFTERPKIKLRQKKIELTMDHFKKNSIRHPEKNQKKFNRIIQAFQHLHTPSQGTNSMEATISEKLLQLIGSETKVQLEDNKIIQGVGQDKSQQQHQQQQHIKTYIQNELVQDTVDKRKLEQLQSLQASPGIMILSSKSPKH